jgi:hypothetical protein
VIKFTFVNLGFYVELDSSWCCTAHQISIIRIIKSKWARWAGHLARFGVEKRCLKGFGEGKIPLGRPRRIWENNNKMNL